MSSTYSNKNNFIYPSGTTSSRPSSPTNGFVYFNTTLGALQIYQGGAWYVLSDIVVPGAPTSVVSTDQGTGRPYNNGQASISFNKATDTVGFPATFTVTPTPSTSPATFSGTSSPIVVTGLQSSTQYTYTVTATNNTGSTSSSSSSGVTATTVPQAPTIGTATAGDGQVSLAFTAGATGGSAITNYKYSTDGTNYTTFSPAQNTSPLTITGLTNGTSYSFYLKAVNANGNSTASSASSPVIPGVSLPVSGATGWFLASDLPSTITDGITWTNRGSGLGNPLISSSTSSASTTSWQGGTALAGVTTFSCNTTAQTNGQFTMIMAQQWTSGVFGPMVAMNACSMLYSPGNPGYYGDGLYFFGNDQTNPAVVAHYRNNGTDSEYHYQRVNGNTYSGYETGRPGATGTFTIYSGHANQRIAEVAIWNRTLNSTELATMETYLRNKYSI